MQKGIAQEQQDRWNRELEHQVRDALHAIRYGTVTLVIQDGRVIQIDKNEKIRLTSQGHMNGSGI